MTGQEFPEPLRPSDHAERLKAAEAVAAWHLGDRYWAQKLVGAYLDPESALRCLALEKEPSS